MTPVEEPSERTRQAESGLVGYQTVGTGPRKVMVLHGWFGDHSVWEPTYPYIDRASFSFVFVDYRGYGASRDLGGPYSIAQISADAIAVADHLRWPSFSVVGHSMGGQAAQRVALDAPGRVQAVIAVTPVPASGAKMPADAEAFFGAVADSDDTGRQLIDVSLGGRLTPGVASYIMRTTRETADVEAFRTYGKAFIATDFGEEARAITIPILVLVGEHDGGVTEASVRSTFPPLYPHVEIEVLPNSGHYPMLETPTWLMTRIERFLAEMVPSGG